MINDPDGPAAPCGIVAASREAASGDILVVDDNRVNVGLITAILRQRGYAVRSAADGPSALSTIRELAPELVLLDIRLPGLDGYEVCRQLKQDPATRDIPVIFVSALDEGMDKVRGFELGGNDYIPKPFQAVEVVARVENQLKIASLQREMVLKNAELERANRMLQSLSYLDPLTGIANRRNFDESFEQEWRRARREEGRVALVMADVDRFKDYNDLYGHPSGDECLRRVALEASNSLRRAGDLAARYGGEEFALVLPGTDVQGARIVAEDVRARVERLQIPHKGSPHGVVTLSLGVAAMAPKDDQPRELLVAAADRALYQAKANGRNRMELEPA